MTEMEIAQIIDTVNMYELSCKTNSGMKLDNVESDAVAELDNHFKAIGKSGHDKDHEIASFVQKVINEEVYNAPDELLDGMFDRGSVGEFDDFESVVMPVKNTLVAHEAAKGGNVDRSFLDISVVKPIYKNRQVETDLSFADVRRNGWKSIALLSEYAVAALKNALFYDVFSMIDNGITSGAENYINETSTRPTQASMDALALYIQDRRDMANGNGRGQIVALSKYVQAASKLTGFVSDDIVNEVHLNGALGMYDSVPMYGISGAKKLGDGSLLIPDKRIYGIAGKVGSLQMKGDINVYQHEDTNKELFHLKFADFTYGVALDKTSLDMCAKIVLA